MVWSKCPKEHFIQLPTCKLCVHDAVIHFNEGHKGCLNILQRMGIAPGMDTMLSMGTLDSRRIKKSEQSFKKLCKKAKKKMPVDADDAYAAGLH